MHKPDVCEAKHTNIANKRVQKEGTAQTRCLRGEVN